MCSRTPGSGNARRPVQRSRRPLPHRFAAVLAAAGFAAWLGGASARAEPAPSPWSSAGHLDLDSMAGFGSGHKLGSESSALLQWGGRFDTGRAGAWKGGRFDLSIEGVRAAGNPTAGTGVLQWPSNEWAPNFLRVYQATFRQRWSHALVRVGIMDVNQYFESSDVADLLHNASFGLAPSFTSNFNDPSFPNPGLGAMGEVHWAHAWRARAGIWQGNPPQLAGALYDGSLRLLELERDWGHSEGGPADDLKLGVWRYTQPVASLGADTAGGYLVGEMRWRQGFRRWGAFVLGGTTPATGNLVRRFAAAGLLLQHPFSQRPRDAFSIGLTQVRIRALHAETILESTYSWQLTRRVALQPDVQRAWNPSGQGAPAWIAGVRVHLVF